MKKTALFFFLFFAILNVSGQETELYRSEFDRYRTGLDLYQKEKYSAAIKEFEEAQNQIQDRQSEIYANATYYKGVCALNLFNKNAAYLLRQFIQNYPESPRVTDAAFQLGKYNYRKRKWENVIKWYDRIDVWDLTVEDAHEYHFRKGYALYQLDSLSKAKKELSEIIDLPNAFYDPANYYYGQIAYDQGNYQTALNTFKKIENADKFDRIIPYYLTQIYYLQEQYDTLISYGKPFLDDPRTKRKSEINRLVGEAYFAREQYKEAVPYLSEYLSEPGVGSREDYFQLGLALKKSGDCKPAVKNLQRATYENDSLAQAANYKLAECQLNLGMKKAALSSFKNAARAEYNSEIREDALYSFALLSYETDYDPYNNAIDAFIEYLENFEDGMRKDEVFEYLVEIYLSTRNYESALASLETTMELDSRLKKTYQKLLYNQGVEYFLNANYNEAANTFLKSSKTPEDRELATRAKYWRAEALYRDEKYRSAAKSFEDFIYEPRAILMDEFPLAQYSIGYSFFKRKQYPEAARWFRKFINNEDAQEIKVNDACIRTGDAYFVTKEYLLSLEYYEKALDYGLMDVDYTLYQLALANGILGKSDEKAELLRQLINEHPQSDFYAAASYELGRSLLQEGKTDKALAVFNEIIAEHVNSPYKKRAQVSKGLIYYNRNENDNALDIFKQVVRENPSYSDSKEALRAIQNIYVERGNVEDYEQYISQLGFLNVTDASLDSLNYESAELQYLSGNCPKAVEAFQKYLDKFETPLFYLSANFYIAECLLKDGRKDSALTYFENVADRAVNKYSEEAVRRAAELNFRKERYIPAFRYYEKLSNIAQQQENKQRASVGMMRAGLHTGQYAKAVKSAEEVLKMEKLSRNNMIDAHYIMARSYHESGDTVKALSKYAEVIDSTRNERAAESKYQKAVIFFSQNRTDTAQKTVMSLINHDPAYNYWLAKGMVLLGDIYLAKDDAFQAKAAFETVLENYDGDEKILNEAEQKLNELIERENPKKKSSGDEIELFLDSSDYDELMPRERIDRSEETEKLIEDED